MTMTLERFATRWQQVGECHIWQGAKNRKGYGRFGYRENGRRVDWLAHRWRYQQLYGTLPEAVMHACDTPACVNPEHLKAGTRLENVRDMDRKGRRVTVAPRGSRNGSSILSADAVLAIRAAVVAGEPQKLLAQQYGISTSQVSNVVRRASWTHIIEEV